MTSGEPDEAAEWPLQTLRGHPLPGEPRGGRERSRLGLLHRLSNADPESGNAFPDSGPALRSSGDALPERFQPAVDLTTCLPRYRGVMEGDRGVITILGIGFGESTYTGAVPQRWHGLSEAGADQVRTTNRG